jgi:transposase
MSKVLQKRY